MSARHAVAAALILASIARPVVAETAEPTPDTWIFSGVMPEGGETFSGTLVTGKTDTQFELKLGGGATCEGGALQPSLGLVRLTEIRCSDGRSLRALFVPQAKQTLKVVGHIGEARFDSVAHLRSRSPAGVAGGRCAAGAHLLDEAPAEAKPSRAPPARLPVPK